jgi:hypothetical protein
MLDLLIVAYAQFVAKVKVQQSLYWTIAGWSGFQEFEAPKFPDIWHVRVVRLSALCTLHLYPPGNIPGLISFRG